MPPRLTLVVRSAGPGVGSGVGPSEDSSESSSPEPQLSDVPTQALASLEAARETGVLRHNLRILEAALFASTSPLDEADLARHLPQDTDLQPLLTALAADYAGRGVTLQRVAGKWAFRTSQDLSHILERHAVEERKLSKAALETLAIIAYHQPVTRAEVEDIRGVTTSKGTLDVLLETGWIRPRGRRRAPGRPLTYGTTGDFLDHFGLDAIKDLPGLADLKGAGLLDGNLPPNFTIPNPTDVAALMPDELPLETGDDGQHDGTDDGDPDLFAALPEDTDDDTERPEASSFDEPLR